jgi:hypothetical protein
VQIRLEVYSSSGKKVFDNEVRGGNVLDWYLQNGQAERLADDTYLCVLTVKNLSGKISQRIGSVIVEKSAASVQAVAASQMTTQQSEAIGPVEEDVSFVVLKEDERQTPTVIAHNGEEGQITRGRGALSFRLGDFYGGKDSEQMRLTAEGNLGIGITNPQARLDVGGRIRASEGIVFPDGSVQFSAATKTFGTASQKPSPFGKNPSSGQEHFAPQATAAGTQNRLAKWTDNVGTLGDSAIVEVNGNIGIGTTSPQSGLDYRNGSAAFFSRDIPANPGTAQSALQLGLSNAGSRNAGVGPSFLFFGENSAGAKSFLGRISAVWENPTAGAETGAIFFQVRANSGDVNALTERMRIQANGNVGIGSPAPTFRLHVVDTGNTGLRVQTNTGGGTLASFGGFGDFLVDAVNVVGGRLSVKENGKVGIGIPNPEFKLDVLSEAGSAIRGEATAAGSGLAGVFGVSHASDGIAAGVLGESDAGRGVAGKTDTGVAVQAYVTANQPGLFMAGSIFNGPRKFHITNDGTYIAGSDFAEALPASKGKADYAPGDVLVLSGEAPGTVEKASRPYDRCVAGVYSTRPGVLGADKQGTSQVDPNDLPVAILGIVPTKVSTENGPVRAGDLLTTSSTPGYAMKASPVRVGRAKVYRTGAILGKALEPLKEGKGIIKVLVSLR